MSLFEQKLTGDVTHDQAASLVDINERLREVAKGKNPRDPKNVATLLQLVEQYSMEFEDELYGTKLGKKILFNSDIIQRYGLKYIQSVLLFGRKILIYGDDQSGKILLDTDGKKYSDNFDHVYVRPHRIGTDSFVALVHRGGSINVVRPQGEDESLIGYRYANIAIVDNCEIVYAYHKINQTNLPAKVIINGINQEWAKKYIKVKAFCSYCKGIACAGYRDGKWWLVLDGKEEEELPDCDSVTNLISNAKDELFVCYTDKRITTVTLVKEIQTNDDSKEVELTRIVNNQVVYSGNYGQMVFMKTSSTAGQGYLDITLTKDKNNPLFTVKESLGIIPFNEDFLVIGRDLSGDGVTVYNYLGVSCIEPSDFVRITDILPVKGNICKVCGIDKNNQAICVTINTMTTVSAEDL